jgi:hypothetical protein
MTDEPAAIRATFSDFRLIKGRKQAQLVLEVPIEEADAALSVLGGIPQPHSDRWVAVARLNGVTKPEPEPKEKQKWDDLKLSMQAVIRCKEKAFWTFLGAESPEDAANVVRARCRVNSRSALNNNPEAAEKWRQIDRLYQTWLKAAEWEKILAQGRKHLPSNEQTDDVKHAGCGYSQDVSHTTILFQTALLVLMILTTVMCSALLAISKRQEMMLDELLKRSGSMQETSVLINPETRSQAGSYQDGKGRWLANGLDGDLAS